MKKLLLLKHIEMKIIMAMYFKNEAIVDPGVHITLVDGVPGCGKTAEIIARVNWKTDLIDSREGGGCYD